MRLGICCTFSSEESIKPLDLYEMKREHGAEEELGRHESFYARERSLSWKFEMFQTGLCCFYSLFAFYLLLFVGLEAISNTIKCSSEQLRTFN